MPLLNRLAQYLVAPFGDILFCRLQFLHRMGRLPDLKNPLTFNEQILWLKLFHRDPLVRICADKFTVREFVRERAGEAYLVPLIDVFDSAEAINFGTLPERFVLKATHGSGWTILCRDKASFDSHEAKRKLRKWMQRDFYQYGREWSYSGLTPRIVCEEFLPGPEEEPPIDYKFWCFLGEPRCVQVDYGRFTHHTQALYDMEWRRLPCQFRYPPVPGDHPPPKTIGLMLEAARKLSQLFLFARVDLYESRGAVFFGEMTFYPGKGIEPFTNGKFDREFGAWLAGRLETKNMESSK